MRTGTKCIVDTVYVTHSHIHTHTHTHTAQRNMWHKHTERVRRQGATHAQVDVTLRDVVTYRDNTITVSRGGEMIRR